MPRTTVVLIVCSTSALILAGRDVPGSAVLWQPPGKIGLSNWIWGPDGEEGAPKPPYQFVEEDFNGTNPKVRVRDVNGQQWTVKFGEEIHGDVFASRLVNAAGYFDPPSYLVASGVVVGVKDLKRAKPFFSKDGRFVYARFKLRDRKSLAKVKDRTWTWADNPFLGKHELGGLKILMMLTSNWDTKDGRDGDGSNVAILADRSTPGRYVYLDNDWGASMGKWGRLLERTTWDSEGYEKQTKDFVKGVKAGIVEWGYHGRHDEIQSGITVEDVRWLLPYLSPITDEQLRAGLRASGASKPDIDRFTSSMRDRIRQLENIPSWHVAGAK